MCQYANVIMCKLDDEMMCKLLANGYLFNNCSAKAER